MIVTHASKRFARYTVYLGKAHECIVSSTIKRKYNQFIPSLDHPHSDRDDDDDDGMRTVSGGTIQFYLQTCVCVCVCVCVCSRLSAVWVLKNELSPTVTILEDGTKRMSRSVDDLSGHLLFPRLYYSAAERYDAWGKMVIATN